MRADELVKSFAIAWLILSLGILLVLLAPFVMSEGTITRLAPKCVWKVRYGKSCPLCGMTTAFVRISQGRLADACKANPSSLALYAAFVVNLLLAALFLTKRRSALLPSQPRGWTPRMAGLGP